MKELPKAYEPRIYEDDLYKRWEGSGFFNPDNVSGEPYAIMMPPPNVTGVLHLGHSLENALMDTMARFQRMQGKKVLLLPGTDHAAVATQAKVEKLLVKEGIKNPRETLGREELLGRIREFAESSKSTILQQIRKMGTSCDWSRLAYTFDEERSRAVNEMFVRMYNDGLIYRGYRVVNWSVKGQSTLSDDELVYIERPAKLYTFKYSHDFPITIATTRPETKLGDTAVAVNPEDERYRDLIGKTFTVDVGAEKPLEIKVIADPGVDMSFGTGALGVTPAHSQTDFEMYEKQKTAGSPIGFVQVIGEQGTMAEAAGSAYAGLPVEEAREKFVNWLREQGLLEREEDIVQNVGTSDRFGDIAEALPMTQWFVAVNKVVPGKNKTLKDLMREAVTTGHGGDSTKRIRITPDRFEKTYLHWIENLRDWCISRQIWWGHRIPVWYREKEVYCGLTPPEGEGWVQDEDTLDTWFSSGLWTFSTLGWPDSTEDFTTFHPTSWMQMGHEILFFWMARMILMTTYGVDQIPFRDVYIHGMLRDAEGKKFSKSSGNGIDPLEVINDYGCDALRFSLLSGITPGNDARFYKEKIEGARNLVNKLWNISRFMLLSIESSAAGVKAVTARTLADRWIVTRLNATVATVTEHISGYNFSYAAEALRDFTWNDLADWYLEIAKIEGDKSELLNQILNTILKLWHPYLPFVTEAIWSEVYGTDQLLMMERFPEALDPGFPDASNFSLVQGIVTGIRSLRADYRIEPNKKVTVVISAGDYTELVENSIQTISGLARLEHVTVETKAEKPASAVGFVEQGVEVFLELAGVVDVAKERERIEKEIAAVEPYVGSLTKKLENEQFIANAPPSVVEAERQKLAEAKDKLGKLQDQLRSLSS